MMENLSIIRIKRVFGKMLLKAVIKASTKTCESSS